MVQCRKALKYVLMTPGFCGNFTSSKQLHMDWFYYLLLLFVALDFLVRIFLWTAIVTLGSSVVAIVIMFLLKLLTPLGYTFAYKKNAPVITFFIVQSTCAFATALIPISLQPGHLFYFDIIPAIIVSGASFIICSFVYLFNEKKFGY
jgi:hypothetical protein